ncbi:uncharacterized protein LOC107025146 [Solanum pennellii]|uniref:ATP-dependent DNA helicase n=1 Tax=Solanum pennellii TaxID=28526 RepID=A0ABM1H7F6_SOLPN|nr:uncharacterized protein LOC107025146 [Solanum pennellii]
MAKRHTIGAVDKRFCDIMDKDAPFGGKVMLFGGDFRQVLPVVQKSTRAETVAAILVRLVLKENAPIMMLRNLDPSNELITGEYAKTVFTPTIQISAPENEGYPFKFIRKLFPIRLCFAMTINRAQALTTPNIGLYLPQHVFSHGQLYVALSRGISMSKTKVLVMTKQPERHTGIYTRNIVYKDVLGEI